MADLLDSILGSMQKPPSLGEEEKKKAKAQKALIEKRQQDEKHRLQSFRHKMQTKLHEFIQDGTREKFKFAPMDKVYRAIIHEVADVAGLASFSFGQEEEDRYVMLWKKEFAPIDEELLAYRRGETWDPEKAKELARLKVIEDKEDQEAALTKKSEFIPNSNYKEKYEHLIGRSSAKEAAISTSVNRSYGFVSSENKRDKRTVEQVLADTRAKKKLKTERAAGGDIDAIGDVNSSSEDRVDVAGTSLSQSDNQEDGAMSSR